MSKIEKALSQAIQLNNLSQRNQWVNNFHPLVKFVLSIVYIAVVVSFDRYDFTRLVTMVIYPIFVFNMADLSFKECLYRLRVILPIVAIVGIFNPLFDKEIIMTIGGVAISGGWVSFFSLMVKGILTVLAAYLLVATTSIESICYSLRMIHVPKTLVTIVLLIYRYIFVFFNEADKVITAYHLRAPKQKGVHFKAWGSLVGNMLLRSMDRADYLYESMSLRGFTGEFKYSKQKGFKAGDWIYFFAWIGIFVVLRYTHVLSLLGGLFV